MYSYIFFKKIRRLAELSEWVFSRWGVYDVAAFLTVKATGKRQEIAMNFISSMWKVLWCSFIFRIVINIQEAVLVKVWNSDMALKSY